MGFYNELITRMGFPPDDAIGGSKVTIIDGKAISIQGYKKIVDLTLTNFEVSFKKGGLQLVGENLSIIEITRDEVLLKGIISDIKWV